MLGMWVCILDMLWNNNWNIDYFFCFLEFDNKFVNWFIFVWNGLKYGYYEIKMMFCKEMKIEICRNWR